MKTGLAALIHPISNNEFITHFEKNEPFVVHNEDKSHLSPLINLPFLSSLESMLKSWPYPIQAHLPDVRDEVSSINANFTDAKKLFDNGMGLLFNGVHNISDVLKVWLEDIRKGSGLSELTDSRCLVYATPKGKGTAPHFDQNINFVLQVHGNKTWIMAPNKHVANPLTRHTMGLPTEPEMQSYMETTMPTSMPNDAKKYELKPGSLLFVPRGYWHSTDAKEDALSLNFTYTAPTWIDLFTLALRSRLALSEEWRETAILRTDELSKSDAEEKFNDLLKSVSADLPSWSADDILDFTEGGV